MTEASLLAVGGFTVSAATSSKLEPPARPLTAADLAVLPAELPSGTVCYELDNGRLVIMAPPGDLHGAADLKIGSALLIQGEYPGFGKARSEVGIILRRNPDKVVGAANAFIANSSLPIRRSPEGYLETIPDLVVEVRSKNDTQPAIEQKVQDYFEAGVKVVWVPDPTTKTITVYRPNAEPQVLSENDILTVEDIIPGFQLAVKDVFQE
jgi:Uma2 family endonuclease